MSDTEKLTVSSTFEELPTGKPHVSFSELRDWQDCSYRHKLKYVDKHLMQQPSPHMDFGTAVHAACEKYLSTRVMDPEISVLFMNEAWKKNEAHAAYSLEALPKFIEEAKAILAEVPQWLENTFPNWEYIDAEHQLYEPLEKYPHAFKGFIDGIIKVKGKRGEDVFWLLDWKSTSWGWATQKKSDPNVQQQLIFYKNFWTKKTGTNPKNVRCGFVLLKRTAKPTLHCELIKVSVGDVTTDRSLKVLNNMVSAVRRGMSIKNRSSCQYCDYKDTELCTLQPIPNVYNEPAFNIIIK